jgi:cytoskeleton protein RodZ
MGKSIGETLRDGRLHQRLSIAECAKRTHISSRYLEALEEQRWNDLPSESHRTGFLTLYARFLGVYSEDLMQAYRQSKQPEPADKPAEMLKPLPKAPAAERLSSMTGPRLSLLVILALVSFWGLYHAFRHFYPAQHVDLSWLRFKSHAPRLVAAKRDVSVQRIKALASADSWLRIADDRQLIFEGILPSGASKEWSGAGPFHIKVGNINAVTLTWNDQPVDLKTETRGSVADFQLPPPAIQEGEARPARPAIQEGEARSERPAVPEPEKR